MILEVNKLSKKFGELTVFENVSFSIEAGEIVCVKGKSGQGKTTLLRCINNLEVADSGRIRINGLDLCVDDDGKARYCSKEELKKIRQQIGLVFQNFNLFPNMTVWQNLVEAPLYLKNGTPEEISNRAKELLSSLDLVDKEKSMPNELSGGQKQRVAIARACMLDPSVLCFDEPTSAVDEETRGQIGSIIRLLAERGMAIIIVTHDNAFVDEIADRVLSLVDGEIVEDR